MQVIYRHGLVTASDNRFMMLARWRSDMNKGKVCAMYFLDMVEMLIMVSMSSVIIFPRSFLFVNPVFLMISLLREFAIKFHQCNKLDVGKEECHKAFIVHQMEYLQSFCRHS
jgi:hypothetical protein